MSPDHDDHNDVHNDISKPLRASRVEVLSGPERRRRWPDSVKIAIAAEALEPGVVVSAVARRHGLYPSQLFDWVKRFRTEAMALRAEQSDQAPLFAPVLTDGTAQAKRPAALPSPMEAGVIEIVLGPATIRIKGMACSKSLGLVLKALKEIA